MKIGGVIIIVALLCTPIPPSAGFTEFEGFWYITDIEYDPNTFSIFVAGQSDQLGIMFFEYNGTHYNVVYNYSEIYAVFSSLLYTNDSLMAVGNVPGISIFTKSLTWELYDVILPDYSEIYHLNRISDESFVFLYEQKLIIWSPDEIKEIQIPNLQDSRTTDIQYNEFTDEIIVKNSFGAIYRLNSKGQFISTIYPDALKFASDPNSNTIAFINETHLVFVDSHEEFVTIPMIPLLDTQRIDLQYSRNSNYLAVIANGSLSIYNSINGELVNKKPLSNGLVVEWMTDTRLITGDDFGNVIIWDILNDLQFGLLGGHGEDFGVAANGKELLKKILLDIIPGIVLFFAAIFVYRKWSKKRKITNSSEGTLYPEYTAKSNMGNG